MRSPKKSIPTNGGNQAKGSVPSLSTFRWVEGAQGNGLPLFWAAPRQTSRRRGLVRVPPNSNRILLQKRLRWRRKTENENRGADAAARFFSDWPEWGAYRCPMATPRQRGKAGSGSLA